MDFIEIAKNAKTASLEIADLADEIKNKALLNIAQYISENKDKIFSANHLDLEEGKKLVAEGEITEYPFSEASEVFPKEIPSDSPDFYNISPLKNSSRFSDVKNFSEAEHVVKINPREYYPSFKKITSVISNFIGIIEQTPPRFSAIRIKGERAYKLARKGQDFEIPSRQIEIYNIDILDYHYPELKIRVHCSSGTYIRTLAEDIGKELGTGAYLTALRRTRIGNFDIEDATPLNKFSQETT